MINKLILIPVIVGITSQVFKLITDGIKGNLSIKTIFITYGGFPSVHTALIVSISTLIGKTESISSPLFALSVVVSILVIRDALGLRNIVEEHSEYINKLTKSSKLNYPKLPKQVGHSVIEILGGIAYGVIISLLLDKYI